MNQSDSKDARSTGVAADAVALPLPGCPYTKSHRRRSIPAPMDKAHFVSMKLGSEAISSSDLRPHTADGVQTRREDPGSIPTDGKTVD
jgi:hypothetical protein